MFKHLEAELIIKGLSKQQLSKKSGIRYETLLGKMRGKSEFSLAEAYKIKVALSTEKTIEELFSLKELMLKS